MTISQKATMQILAIAAMGLAQSHLPPERAAPSRYRGPSKTITKAERAKRNVRKNIAKRSKKRNRRV